MSSEKARVALGTSAFPIDTLRVIATGGTAEQHGTIVVPFWCGFSVAFLLTLLLAVLMKGGLARMTSWFCWPVEKCRQVSSLAVVGEPVKMTLVVRKDLKMGNGKIAAQCAHAAVAVVEEILAIRSAQHTSPPEAAVLDDTSQLWLRWYDAWHASGCSKMALQCPDEATMMAIARHAKEKKLPFYVIRDAGRTQIAPGSKTVVAVGPGPKSLVDEVTGQLKLL
jgi:peptidyl-tRNA hydrolase, PTH2 family